MAMNSARFRSLWNNMTPTLRKVYCGVPEDNVMTNNAIHAVLARNGQGRDLHNTQGCLNTLLGMGLIAEPERGCFVRVEVRGVMPADAAYIEDKPQEKTAMQTAFETAKPVATPAPSTTLTLAPKPVSEGITSLIAQPQPEVQAPVTPVVAATPTDPIDRLTKITAALRGLADDIESTALDFTEQLAMIEAKTKKLEALREMLKGVLV